MRQQINQNDFLLLKNKYITENGKFKKRFLYHLGSSVEGQGVYSELGSMLECICWCYQKGYQFILYSDDCNFTGGHGFEVFFDAFCPMDHHKINIKHNHRYPSPTFRRKLADFVVKKVVHVNALTSEYFFEFIDETFQDTEIMWEAMGLSGSVGVEKGRLLGLAMHFNEETWRAIVQKVAGVGLPEHFVSVQMRGGDKSIETQILGAAEYVRKMEEGNAEIENVFIFTDDYAFVIAVKELRPNWNVYTLAQEDEAGFYLDKFNAMSWDEKREDMIKLFAMMEICYSSDIHYGYGKASTDRVIRAVRCSEGMKYISI